MPNLHDHDDTCDCGCMACIDPERYDDHMCLDFNPNQKESNTVETNPKITEEQVNINKEVEVENSGNYVYLVGYGPEGLIKAIPEVKSYIAQEIEKPMLRLKEKHGDNLVVVSTLHEGFQAAMVRVAVKNGIKVLGLEANPGFARRYWGLPNKLKNGKTVGSLTGAENRAQYMWLKNNCWKFETLAQGIDVDLGNGNKIHSLQFRDNQVAEMAHYCIMYNRNDINSSRGETRMNQRNVPIVVIRNWVNPNNNQEVK